MCVCDLCGKRVPDAITVVVGLDDETWELDLCPADNKRLHAQFDRWLPRGSAPRTVDLQRDPPPQSGQQPPNGTPPPPPFLP